MTELKNNYVVDTPYVYLFWATSSPTYLRFATQVAGYSVKPTESLRILDLGCGQGFGACLLAAANSDCEIVGVDFNAEHISNGRELAESADLKNVTFIQGAFTDLLNNKDLMKQRFDIVIIHGVYSWVDQDNRRAIHDIINKVTDDGAIIFVSYNSLPGRNQFDTIQQLILMHADYNQKSNRDKAYEGIAFIDKLKAMNYQFLRQNQFGTKQIVDDLKNTREGYVIHAYLHRNPGSYYFHHVNDWFEKDHFKFAGSTNLRLNDIEFTTDELAVSDDLQWKETLKDFYNNTQFRTDIFIKNPVKMLESDREDALRRVPITTQVHPKQAGLQAGGYNNANITSQESFNTVIRLFEEGIPTIGDVADALKPHFNFEQSLSWLKAWIDQDKIRVLRMTPASPEASYRFNDVVCADKPYGHRYQFFASALMGSGIVAASSTAFIMTVDQPSNDLNFESLFLKLQTHAKSYPEMAKGLPGVTDIHDEVRVTAALAALAYTAIGHDYPHARKIGLIP